MLLREERILLDNTAKIISLLKYFYFACVNKLVCYISVVVNKMKWSFLE